MLSIVGQTLYAEEATSEPAAPKQVSSYYPTYPATKPATGAQAELIKRGFGDAGLPDGCAMFGGTFAAKGGIRAANRFEYELEDPVLTKIKLSVDRSCR